MGMDVDLMKALGAAMGLKVNVVNASFEGIIPGLAAGKYDIGASSFTDNKEREKTVDFVTYFTAGESFYTKAQGGTASPASPTCAAQRGRREGDDRAARRHRPEREVQEGRQARRDGAHVPGPERRQPRRVSGKAQFGFADSPVAEYQVKKSNGQFKLVGAAYAQRPVRHRRTQGQRPHEAAPGRRPGPDEERQLQPDPHKWGVQAGAIPDPKINGGDQLAPESD